MTDRTKLLLGGLLAALTAGLMAHAQTHAFAWDEGWHLLAAQSIFRGKRLYLDFCYPQTPLNAYWNAGWFHVFGDTWRTAHAVAAVMTALAVLLTVDYLRRRFPVPDWRMPAAILGVFLVGVNSKVFRFGAIGQAYALCEFLIVAAFRATVVAVERPRLWPAALAGFCAVAAANASLLTAPVAPLLLLWMIFYNRSGSRWTKLAAFLVAGAIPCLPLAWLYTQGPRQTIFNVIDYHLYYRMVEWSGAIAHDFGVMIGWIDSSQALLLGALALIGLLFVRKGPWDRAQRGEFYLCACLAVAEIVHIARAHPHFPQYYLFAVPFLAILACAGLYAFTARLTMADRPFWPVLLLSVMMCLGLGKELWDNRENFIWQNTEAIVRKINQVTPPQGMLLSDELVYFVSRRPPPSGMELEDSHKLHLAAAAMAQLHLVSWAELDRRTKAGVFDTVEIYDDKDRVEKLGLPRLYKHTAVIADADIFWDKVR